ncbi:MAG TPA: glycosyl transferase family 1 [Cyanobacteria bacterium UBA8156]|nr:glycosyl transferase family 1 [Cyanobacteria bacterium UBA8156]
MRVALVHEWLTTYAGSERVLAQLLQVFPQADLFAVVDFLPPEHRAFLAGKPVHTSFLQHWPGARQHFRRYLPWMPLAIEQLNLTGYDLVISSHHAVAKGVLTGPDQLHLCYVHSPMRYAWDLQHQYLGDRPSSWPARWLLHQLRQWDRHSAQGVDAFAANSQYIARRIAKCYRRPAQVIYPPVDVESFALNTAPREPFYVTAARFVPYKRVDVVVEAFRQWGDRPLVVIGDGPERAKIEQHAGANIHFVGYQPPDRLAGFLQKAQAFVFAAEEDFGITVVEAQACGTPVIALGRGGATETIGPDRTGLWFDEQTPASLLATLRAFEEQRQRHPERFTPEQCRANALRFAPDRFRREIQQWVDRNWHTFQEGPLLP